MIITSTIVLIIVNPKSNLHGLPSAAAAAASSQASPSAQFCKRTFCFLSFRLNLRRPMCQSVFVDHRGISVVEVHRWVGAALDRRDFCGARAFSRGTVRKAVCRNRVYFLDVSDMFQSYDVELWVPPFSWARLTSLVPWLWQSRNQDECQGTGNHEGKTGHGKLWTSNWSSESKRRLILGPNGKILLPQGPH